MEMTNWKKVFDEQYYEYFQNVDNSLEEAGFLIDALSLKKDDSILDIGCGNGRHLFRLHEAGFRDLTGIDFSENFIRSAEKGAKEQKISDIAFVYADFLQHEFGKLFDKAYSFFSGFGYFSDEKNEEYISKVAYILKPEGMFLLDIFNYEYFIKNYQDVVEFEKGDLHFLNKNHFDFEKSINKAENIITNKKTGQIRDYSYTMRYYSISEIKDMLAKNDLEVLATFGDYKGGKLEPQSKRAIFVCRKSSKEGSK